MKKIYLFPITLLLCYFVTLSKIHAQSVGLSVSPPVVEVLIAPGKKVMQTFNLQALGNNLFTDKTGVTVIPELHLVKPLDNVGQVTLDPAPANLENLPFTITTTPPLNQAFTIPAPTSPAGRSLLAYTLTLEAANTDVTQDIYLALVFQVSPSSTTNDLRSTITTPSISALILITLNPTSGMPIELSIKEFDLPQIHDSWLPLTLEPVLSNNSPTMIRPQGLYEIISPSGKTLLSLPLYPNLILGHSSRLIQATTPGVKGSHTPGVLTWSPKWSNLGPHTLRLTITTESGTQLTQLEKVIWLLPLRLLIIIILLIFCLLTVIYKMFKFKIV